MANMIGILRRSVMMKGCKVANASAEYKRRWKYISEESSRSEYTNLLTGMGYPIEWIEKVILGAIKG